ncbi:MAG: hypothetical protein R2712_29425 [Vicinamibacterales bacterium]
MPTGAELVHAALRHEAALTLADALIRRIGAGSAGHPGDDAAARRPRLSQELNWSDTRRDQRWRWRWRPSTGYQ